MNTLLEQNILLNPSFHICVPLMPCRNCSSVLFTGPWKSLYMASIMTFSNMNVRVCKERVYYPFAFILPFSTFVLASFVTGAGPYVINSDKPVERGLKICFLHCNITCIVVWLLHFTHALLGNSEFSTQKRTQAQHASV